MFNNYPTILTVQQFPHVTITVLRHALIQLGERFGVIFLFNNYPTILTVQQFPHVTITVLRHALIQLGERKRIKKTSAYLYRPIENSHCLSEYL